MKKNIIFFVSSAVDLMDLYLVLKTKFNIIWVVYNKGVYEFLKKKNIENVYIVNLSWKIFANKNILIKFIKYVANIFNITFKSNNFFKDLENIEKEYSPKIIITDSGQPLANYKTQSIKINTKHSVCYKKYFLSEVNFKYDYVFLPGYYHNDRIKKIYKSETINTKFKVVGNIKVSQFLKNNDNNRIKFFDSLNLNPNKKTVLFAPSWDAHGKDFFKGPRFLPKSYGNQQLALKKLAKELNLINCNLIIKLHHASSFYLKKDFIINLQEEKNCYVFKDLDYHDVIESNNIFQFSDIIITDTSGVASTGIFLNKKLIFINPHAKYDWHYSDIEKEFRPGFICNQFEEIINSIKDYKNNKDPYAEERKNFIEKIFFNPSTNANIKIAQIIDEITS